MARRDNESGVLITLVGMEKPSAVSLDQLLSSRSTRRGEPPLFVACAAIFEVRLHDVRHFGEFNAKADNPIDTQAPTVLRGERDL